MGRADVGALRAGGGGRSGSAKELAWLEQELLNRYWLAGTGTGRGDDALAADRAAVRELAGFGQCPV
ncbi:hypothetical protein ACIP10_37090 [Streptomyces galbus]|uniref:hypothetical protein n=1 Tax=Streptomyces galbus TaxID=33898 RepID=UPI003828F34B